MSNQSNPSSDTVPRQEGTTLRATLQSLKLDYRVAKPMAGQDPTMGGLFAESSAKGQSVMGNREKNTVSVNFPSSSTHLLTTSADERATLMGKLRGLDVIIAQHGLREISPRVDRFHSEMANVKRDLKVKYGNGVVPNRVVESVQEHMKPFAVNCFRLQIIAKRTSLTPFPGGQRTKDNFYVGSKVLRSVYVDRMLSEDEVSKIIDTLLAETTVVKNNSGYLLRNNTLVPVTQDVVATSMGENVSQARFEPPKRTMRTISSDPRVRD